MSFTAFKSVSRRGEGDDVGLVLALEAQPRHAEPKQVGNEVVAHLGHYVTT